MRLRAGLAKALLTVTGEADVTHGTFSEPELASVHSIQVLTTSALKPENLDGQVTRTSALLKHTGSRRARAAVTGPVKQPVKQSP